MGVIYKIFSENNDLCKNSKFFLDKTVNLYSIIKGNLKIFIINEYLNNSKMNKLKKHVTCSLIEIGGKFG